MAYKVHLFVPKIYFVNSPASKMPYVGLELAILGRN